MKNIIFYDSEFTSLNPDKGELLSIGMVKENGEELYIEIEHTGEVSDWVQEHILPTLTGPSVSRAEARQKIATFIGDGQPYLMAYVNHYDMTYLMKLFDVDENTKELPFNWLGLDFASGLFANGYDPEVLVTAKRAAFLKKLGISNSDYREHNALDDAKLLREVYIKMTQRA